MALLDRRLTLDVFTTEDSIRYTFFAALLDQGTPAEQVVLEWPHPMIPGARIDTVVTDDGGQPVAAIEFKYDRAGPGAASQPRPQKAGAAFADLRRLAVLAVPHERYFVYATDRELARYLASPRNGLHEVFQLDVGAQLEVDAGYFVGRSATFLGALGEWPGKVRPEGVASVLRPKSVSNTWRVR